MREPAWVCEEDEEANDAAVRTSFSLGPFRDLALSTRARVPVYLGPILSASTMGPQSNGLLSPFFYSHV